MNTQSKITTESNAGRILRILARQDAAHYNSELIKDELHPISKPAVDAAILWLMRLELIYLVCGQFLLTTKGETYYHGLCKESKINTGSSVKRWGDEALTGMTTEKSKLSNFQVSAKSTIRDAVLPRNRRSAYGSVLAESNDLRSDAVSSARKAIAEKLGISLDQIAVYLEKGQIKVCKKCKEPQLHDRDRDYVRSPCRKCRKDMRDAGKNRQA